MRKDSPVSEGLVVRPAPESGKARQMDTLTRERLRTLLSLAVSIGKRQGLLGDQPSAKPLPEHREESTMSSTAKAGH